MANSRFLRAILVEMVLKMLAIDMAVINTSLLQNSQILLASKGKNLYEAHLEVKILKNTFCYITKLA